MWERYRLPLPQRGRYRKFLNLVINYSIIRPPLWGRGKGRNNIKSNMDEIEYRFQEETELRVTKDESGKQYLEGYGIVFNSDSRMIYGIFKERIMPESINDGTDMTEIISKFNHDLNRTLGTTWANTLTWKKDTKGVFYKVELPNTETGREVAVLAERGDLRGSSFEFQLAKEGYRWEVEKIGDVEVDVRVITNIKKIADLSPVIRPAYPGTENTIKTYKRQIEEAHGTKRTDEDTPPEKVKKYWFSK